MKGKLNYVAFNVLGFIFQVFYYFLVLLGQL